MKKIFAKTPFILCAFVILFITNRLKAQTSVLGPSPNATSLGQYANMSQNNFYTGTAIINVPIGSVGLSDFKVPISLVYNCGGIQVQSNASWVGTGWSLNAGGVITRSVVGYPDDEQPSGGTGHWGWLTTGSSIDGFYTDPNTDPNIGSNHLATNESTTINDIELNYSANKYDTDPDVFYLNFCGRSGKFIFDKSGNARFISEQNLKVSYTQDPVTHKINSFTVIDESGVQYIFDIVESTSGTSYSYTSGSPTGTAITAYNSSWYLDKIITPSCAGSSSRYIQFTYANETQTYSGSFSQAFLNSTTIQYRTDYSISAQRLTQITYPGGYVSFVPTSTVRADLSGSYALSQINFYTQIGNLSAVLSSGYSFTYITTSASDYGNFHFGTGGPTTCSRMFLDHINELGSDGVSSDAKYQFTYNSTTLPAQASFSVDFWGYYNGKSNTSMLPTTYVYPEQSNPKKIRVFPLPASIHNPASYSYTLTKADMTSDATYAQAGILQTITYPDGGSTQYQYELNQFVADDGQIHSGGGVRIKQITSHDNVSSSNDLTTKYQYPDNSGACSGKIVWLPTYGYDMNEGSASTSDCGTDPYWSANLTIQSSNLAELGVTQGSWVGYTQVTQLLGANGKSVYNFSMPATVDNPSDCSPGDCLYKLPVTGYTRDNYGYTHSQTAFLNCIDFSSYTYPFAPLMDYDWERGLLLSKIDYDAANKKIHEVDNTYTLLTTSDQGVVNALRFANIRNAVTYSPGSIGMWIYSKYQYLVGRAKVLSSTTETQYDEDPAFSNSISTTQAFSYDNPNLMIPTTTTATNSDGISYINKTYYSSAYNMSSSAATDVPSIALKYMWNNHILNYPVEKLNYQQKPSQPAYVISGSLSAYQVTSDGILEPYQSFILDCTVPFSSGFSLAYVNSSTGLFIHNSNYRLTNTFDLYDDFGNLLQTTVSNGISTSIIYSHYSNLPTAKFTNAHNVDNALGNECGFTSFEQGSSTTSQIPDENYWSINSYNTLVTTDAHSGDYCRLIPGGSIGSPKYSPSREFQPITQNQKFLFSCWVKTGSGYVGSNAKLVIYSTTGGLTGSVYPSLSEASVNTPIAYATGWQYYEAVLDLGKIKTDGSISSGTYLNIVCYVMNTDGNSVYIDDMKFQPVLSEGTYKTYDHTSRQLSSQTNNDHISSYVTYDIFGRNQWELDMNGNAISKNIYHTSTGGSDYTYIQTDNMTASGTTLSSPSYSGAISNITYLDGLSRDLQNIEIAASPTSHDIIKPVIYDNLGRQVYEYLPYSTTSGTSGSYRSSAVTDQAYFYRTAVRTAHCLNPFYQNKFETNLLSRTTERSAPGSEWAMSSSTNTTAHTMMYAYRTNTCYDNVLYWYYDYGTNQWKASQFYAPGTLSVTEVRDQDYHWTLIFKDLLGRTICSYAQKTEATNSQKEAPPYSYENYIATYNLYNDLGQLAATIQPQGINSLLSTGGSSYTLTSDIITKWVNTYSYDLRGRVAVKDAGKESEEDNVYDRLDRLILHRTQNNSSLEWNFTKYDILGRAIENGLYVAGSGSTQSSLQSAADGSTYWYESRTGSSFSTQQGYTNNDFPTIDLSKLLMVSYYDDYDFNCDGTPDLTVYSGSANIPTLGRLTASKELTINPDGSFGSTWYLGSLFYDDHGRILHLEKANTQGGTDKITNSYNFVNKLTSSVRIHPINGSGSNLLTITTSYNYDNRMRLSSVNHQIGSGTTVMLAQYVYNEIGQDIEKNLHSTNGGSTFLQSVDYAYNAQGWLTNINKANLGNDYSTPSNWPTYATANNVGANSNFSGYNFSTSIPNTQFMSISTTSASNVANNVIGYMFDNGGPVDFTNIDYMAGRISSKIISNLVSQAGSQTALENNLVATLVLNCGISTYGNLANAKIDINYQNYPMQTLLLYQLKSDIKNQLTPIIGLDRPTTNATLDGYLPADISTYTSGLYTVAPSIWDLPASNPLMSGCSSSYLTGTFETNLANTLFTNLNLLPPFTTASAVNANMQSTVNGYTDGSCSYNEWMVVPTTAYYIPDADANNSSVVIPAIAMATATMVVGDMQRDGLTESDFATCSFLGYNVSAAMADPQYTSRPNTTKLTYEVEYVVQNALTTTVTTPGASPTNFTSAINTSISSYLPSVMATVPNPVLYFNNDNNDLFGMEIMYNYTGATTKPIYNGFVSGYKWSVSGSSDENDYYFNYDPLGRLTKASFYNINGSGNQENTDRYSMPALTYDDNGNILTLQRNGANGGSPGSYTYGLMDNLSYYYTGNKLIGVNDAVAGNMLHIGDFQDNGHTSVPNPAISGTWEYSYSANGSMTADVNKGITSITYNTLDLPATVTMYNGSTNDLLKFTYMADGTKIDMSVYLAGSSTPSYTFDYINGITYESTPSTSSTMTYIAHQQGQIAVSPSGGGYSYDYQYSISDYQGNVRVIFHNNGGTAQIVQRTDYDPFGLKISTLCNILSVEDKLNEFNGHEFMDQIDYLDYYNYGARLYDPQLGQWHVPDPAAQYASPYVYCGNNPLNYTDHNGRFAFVDDFIVGFIEGAIGSIGGHHQPGHHTVMGDALAKGASETVNCAKLYAGLFAWNPTNGNTFGGICESVWEVFSRLTWQLPQTVAGLVSSEASNMCGFVNNVAFFDGATISIDDNQLGEWGAFTLGSYIQGDFTIRPDPDNELFQHEYGHYIQSQEFGLAYLSKCAIPSAINAANTSTERQHDLFSVEQDANKKAIKYWNTRHKGVIWHGDAADPNSNFVPGFDPTQSINSPGNQAALKENLSTNFSDVLIDIDFSMLEIGLLALIFL